MPGILPMKVIKVGTSSQSRIAQACDRCRSKKIRCDGIRPCCSQCANVGFECKTSDKLSRRAFPRGYTESLEERVRQLESEVRELKDLLDEKDEKIDMLSKMHSNNHHRPSIDSTSGSRPGVDAKRDATPPAKEDTFRVQASPLLLGVENSDSYFMGASSGRAFIETFKRKIQEHGKPCPEFNPEIFLHIQGCQPLTAEQPAQNMKTPSRMFSDRCVNIYFQEWAPLFPVIHKPSFLRIYEEYVADPEKIKNNHKLTQLYLVFCIAALSSENPDLEQIAACEQQWQRSLDAILMDNTMITLQCLVLALMYCTVRADYKRLQHYKGVAVGLSHRLGLHQSQKRFSFGALTIETRKKVFWTLYTLDCFSAAILGLPKLLKEEDIHAEYPSDTDDEYVTEKGFQPSLPGEHTRLSSALALFRGTRILAKVLETNYPAATSHELSLQQMSALDAELDNWCDNLPTHLKLTFRQDKPSTDITGSRSPLLALAYYYTKTLIWRPAVGSSLGSKAAPALISISDSSKHIVQIIQLLEERNMSIAFCLNKADVLVLCGMTLLYQSLDLKDDSKVMKDNTRLANAVIQIVEKTKAAGSLDFKRIAEMLIHVDEPLVAQQHQPQPPISSLPTPPRTSPDIRMPAPAPPRSSPPTSHAQHQQHMLARNDSKTRSLGRHVGASMSETDLLLQQEKLRRITMQQASMGRNRQSAELHRVRARPSFDGIPETQIPLSRREHRLSLSEVHAAQAAMIARVSPTPCANSKQHLDYLSFSSPPPHSHAQPTSPVQARNHQSHTNMAQAHIYSQLAQKSSTPSTAEWEALVGSLDGGAINLYDAIYGGHGMPLTETPVSTDSWSPDAWDLSQFNIGDFDNGVGTAQSVLSISEESLSSADEYPAKSELGASVGSLDYHHGHQTQHLPTTCTTSNGYLDDLGHFNL